LGVELELAVPLDFFVADADDVEDFLAESVVAACVVVVAVSCWCEHETTKAAPAMAVVRPRTNFFIVNGYFRVRKARLVNSFSDRKHLIPQGETFSRKGRTKSVTGVGIPF
jgi:hypothetical protein